MARGDKSHPKPKVDKDLQISVAMDGLIPYLKIVGVISSILAAYFIAQGITKPLHYISTYNVDQMREVFLGNTTAWVVLCNDGSSQAIDKNFETAAKENVGGAKYAILDCSGTLPSGKNVYTKFGISSTVQPSVVFITAPGSKKPQQAKERHFLSPLTFQKWVRDTIEPRSVTVSKKADLESRCLAEAECALVLKVGDIEEEEKAAVKAAMSRHRHIRFASMDWKKYSLSFEAKLKINPHDAGHMVLYFSNYTASGAPTKATKSVPKWGLGVHSSGLSSIGEWLDNVGEKELVPITKAPNVTLRPKPSANKPKKKAKTQEKAKDNTPPAEVDPKNPYDGKTKAEILEEFRIKREAKQREDMEAERADANIHHEEEESEPIEYARHRDASSDSEDVVDLDEG